MSRLQIQQQQLATQTPHQRLCAPYQGRRLEPEFCRITDKSQERRDLWVQGGWGSGGVGPCQVGEQGGEGQGELSWRVGGGHGVGVPGVRGSQGRQGEGLGGQGGVQAVQCGALCLKPIDWIRELFQNPDE